MSENPDEVQVVVNHAKKETYYIVIPFDNKPIDFPKDPKLKQRINTYLAKVRPLSDFMGIK